MWWVGVRLEDDMSVRNTSYAGWQKGEWQTAENKVLLDKCASYLNMVGPEEISHKENDVATDLENISSDKKTAQRCDNHYKTVTKRTNVTVDNNNKISGSCNEGIASEAEVRSIAAVDDYVLPEVLKGVDKVIINLTKFSILNFINY
ncbi:hypothetical protein PR048_010818 [Dryococelus australis]|uniref:Uncharacterized protein n=1 Tax=Dryococelus australis TaxID=614101 RepID=A0ABQ9I3S2_9NEOP|nr:hypothetical protein PR048_010818 [Dryococelus australis]